MAVVAVPFGASVARADDQADGYLKDGKLKERLEILELQGGVAGYTGTYCMIEPDGTWSTGEVLPRDEKKPKATGTLTGEQLTQLAKALAKHDLANLESIGVPVVNPRFTRVRFGDKVSDLQPNADKSPTAEEKLIRARYDGIVQAVKQLCAESKKE